MSPIVRRIGWTGAASLALVAAVAASVAIGSVALPVDEIVAALGGARVTDAHLIVGDLRLPRTVAGLVAGSCLGVAGVLLQGATRNPLASPPSSPSAPRCPRCCCR